MTKITKVLKILLLYISVVGIITFSLFILEESFQTIMFGTWAAQDAGDWQTVKDGLTLMKSVNTTAIYLNNFVGWIQPLAFLSYKAYSKSANYYIAALQSKILAHAPELFINEQITFYFTPTKQTRLKSGEIRASSGKIYVYLPSQRINTIYRLSGKLVRDGEKLEMRLN